MSETLEHCVDLLRRMLIEVSKLYALKSRDN